MVSENKINKELVLIFPSMIIQYLFKEFGFGGTLANELVLDRLKSDATEEELNLYLEQGFYAFKLSDVTE